MNEDEVKKLLAESYSKKAINEADDIWETNNMSKEDMEKWLHS